MDNRKIIGTALCYIGNVRKKNEDNLLFLDRNLEMDHEGSIVPLYHEEILLGEGGRKDALFGVFDGMGGYSNGEEASWIASQIAKDTYQRIKNGEEFSPDMLKDICFESNMKICNIMKERHLKMGTTASMLHFSGDKLYLCNIGDSPIYRFREGEIHPIFREHSQRVYFEKMGNIKGIENKKFPLTQCIGIPPREFKISPYLAEIDCQKGDIYVICSDGLSDMVRIEKIMHVLEKAIPLEKKIVQLLHDALSNGGKDNITMILLEIV